VLKKLYADARGGDQRAATTVGRRRPAQVPLSARGRVIAETAALETLSFEISPEIVRHGARTDGARAARRRCTIRAWWQ
jgi:hypothetical protein